MAGKGTLHKLRILTFNGFLVQGDVYCFSCCLSFFMFIHLGKKTKGTKRYVPQKNSVAYALLITLYRYNGQIVICFVEFLFKFMCNIRFTIRGTTNGNEYMRKQELIDAAEASGLSRVAIA